MHETEASPELELVTPVAPIRDQPIRWSLTTRIVFRFCFCYFLPLGVSLCCNSLQILDAAWPSVFWRIYKLAPENLIVPWVWQHLLGKHGQVFGWPETDTPFAILHHLCIIALAMAAALLWSILDRKRLQYVRLYAWCALFLRVALSATLFGYAFIKLFPLQFGTLTPYSLLQQVGMLSRQGLLWTFMAASRGYTLFGGILELIAAILLLLPWLDTIGALLAAGVMLNVFVLNLAYDVTVKILSFDLLLIAVFLAMPAAWSLTQTAVMRRPASPVRPPQWFRSAPRNRSVTFAVVVLAPLFFCLWYGIAQQRYQRFQLRVEAASKAPFYGAWAVEDFSRSKDAPQSLFTDKLAKEYRLRSGDEAWHRLIFLGPKEMLIQLDNDEFDRVALELDAKTGSAVVTDSDDPLWKCNLTLQSTGNNSVNLQGVVNGVAIAGRLHRIDTTRNNLTQ